MLGSEVRYGESVPSLIVSSNLSWAGKETVRNEFEIDYPDAVCAIRKSDGQALPCVISNSTNLAHEQ